MNIQITEDKLFTYHSQLNTIYGCLLAGQTKEQIMERFPDFMNMLDKVNSEMQKYKIKN